MTTNRIINDIFSAVASARDMDHWQPESMLERRGSSNVVRSAGFYKHSAPLEPGGDGGSAGSTNIRLRWSREGMEGLRVLQTFGSSGAGTGWRAAGSTNIRLLWSREGMGAAGSTSIRLLWRREGVEGCGFYKHSAPLEPGGDGGLRVLQTFGSSGAGRGWRAAGSTNIRLLWSREGMEGLRVLQTFGSSGAGRGWRGCGFYKHSAPLEPGGDEMLAVGHYCGYYY